MDLIPLQADLWLLSPACQPYTVLNPHAKGHKDPRAASFLHLITTVLPDLVQISAHPKWMLVENVAGFEVRSTVILDGMSSNSSVITTELRYA